MKPRQPNPLFRAFANWCIRRAMRTPYFHVRHEDGTPYMDRFWLFRWGGSREIGQEPSVHPWIALNVHHIRSSDWSTYHDHPWGFFTLILRGRYTEVTPQPFIGVPLGFGGYTRYRTYRAGSLRFVRARQWHYLTLEPGEDAWTLVLKLPKVQTWGFLVNGIKVPWREYLKQRAELMVDRPAVRQRDL